MRAVKRYERIQAAELKRRGYSFIFVQANTQRFFLIVPENMLSKLGKRFTLTMEETVKNSIAKQAMSFQMGKPIGQTRKELRSYYAMVLPEPSVGAYSAWEAF